MPKRWTTFNQFLNEAQNEPLENRQSLVDALFKEHPDWPWVDGNQATFIYARAGVKSVGINLDTIKADPPFVMMQQLAGTTLWYISLNFNIDDLLDYMVVIDDPQTPLAQERNILKRINKHWQADPYNPSRLVSSQMKVSVLHMPEARPFPEWEKFKRVPRGTVTEHKISSRALGFQDRKLWVYTPAEYQNSDRDYPLMILMDGQWANGALQIPYMADTLIKHGKLEPIVIAMLESGDQSDRYETMISNDHHYQFLLTELLPLVQGNYRIDATNLGIGGMGEGAIAAAHASLKNPAVFSHLIMISPPMGKGMAEEKLRLYPARFDKAKLLPKRIFQSVGRYEMKARYHIPALVLRATLKKRSDIAYRFVEIGSGHGLVGFRSILPEALAWVFPAENPDGEEAER